MTGMTLPVYFDHNATTPLDERVLEAMLPYLKTHYGNASSRHMYGTQARKAVNEARARVAAAVGVEPVQVVFVSGGTEANNTFIKGAAAQQTPSQIGVSAIEHPCIARPAQELARVGWKLRKLAVDSEGRIDLADVEAALMQPTGIVSVMLANNETGVIQDVAAVAELARRRKAWMHTDAVQAFGKIAVDFTSLNVHAMTISAHKIYGPKGAAALILDKRLELKPLLSGGGHEKGMRSGTENVPAIVGFGKACELAIIRLRDISSSLQVMRDRLENGLRGMGARIFGGNVQRLPNTCYFAFPGIGGETLVIELDKAGYAVASGSACSSVSHDPSPTLLAMGVAPEIAESAVRVSLGKDNKMQEVEGFLQAIGSVLNRLKRLSAIAV
ncbi:MAG TPA: cysteine desulfurase family protein [Burkholderiales bacterium]|nr:cysteine desulfurase family protein [Burkholderiales bacterium]